MRGMTTLLILQLALGGSALRAPPNQRAPPRIVKSECAPRRVVRRAAPDEIIVDVEPTDEDRVLAAVHRALDTCSSTAEVGASCVVVEREEVGAGRGGARWRVVAAWARWERSGLLTHLEDRERNTLRDALAEAAPSAVVTNDADALEARLEIVEVVLCVGGDATTCVAAFRTAGGADDTSALASEVSTLRRTLTAPVAAETTDASAIERRRERKERAVDAWLAIDACAVDVRRKAAVETRDARALVAELATTAVALRRLDPLRRKRVALQAVHVHLPLGELLGDTQAAALSPPQRAAYRALLDDIEARSYATLFPESYAHARRNVAKAAVAVGPAGRDAFAAACRASLSETIAASDALLAQFFPCDASALVAESATALVLPPAVRIERRLIVEARVKTAASALRKMLSSANTKAVRDVLGLRVIVLGERAEDDADMSSLYAVREALHCLGNELKHRAKDYVQAPKASGYRSLHSTLLRPNDGLLVEVQIRTRDMHWQATFGDASHYELDRRDPLLRETADVKKLFDAFDADRSGRISINEVAGLLTRLGAPRGEAEVRALVAQVDSDGDGEISYAEFEAMLESQHDLAGLVNEQRAAIKELQRSTPALLPGPSAGD